ncbi:MAG: serine/threonine protein phosphatase [Magnetococcales bacterium]|nr:serine/threonine protein phosphatase [Magnetococcales bacterium]
MISLQLRRFAEPVLLRNVPFPPGARLHELLITGPPGSGKSTLIQRLGGWSEEGYVDLSDRQWWTSRSLTLRPRELHLLLPFQGMEKAVSVYEPHWLKQNHALDFGRMCIPPEGRYFLSTDWRRKYVIEFLLPPVDRVLAWRRERSRRGTHPVDVEISREQIAHQMLIYWNVAKHLHRCGLRVHLREGVDEPPLEIVDAMDYEAL